MWSVPEPYSPTRAVWYPSRDLEVVRRVNKSNVLADHRKAVQEVHHIYRLDASREERERLSAWNLTIHSAVLDVLYRGKPPEAYYAVSQLVIESMDSPPLGGGVRYFTPDWRPLGY